MSGLFGGKPKSSSVNVGKLTPYEGVQLAQQIRNGQQTETQAAANNAKKGATDLEKLLNRKELKNAYGAAVQFKPDNLLAGDTTLASGSLLNLGGTLG